MGDGAPAEFGGDAEPFEVGGEVAGGGGEPFGYGLVAEGVVVALPPGCLGDPVFAGDGLEADPVLGGGELPDDVDVVVFGAGAALAASEVFAGVVDATPSGVTGSEG